MVGMLQVWMEWLNREVRALMAMVPRCLRWALASPSGPRALDEESRRTASNTCSGVKGGKGCVYGGVFFKGT